jgi:hypothetical protein
MWRLKPDAPADFARLGPAAAPLMMAVSAACAAAALGLWTGKFWGHRIALGLLIINLVGDTVNALFRGDRRSLIGLPIGGLMIAYLLSRRLREWFGLRYDLSGSLTESPSSHTTPSGSDNNLSGLE